MVSYNRDCAVCFRYHVLILVVVEDGLVLGCFWYVWHLKSLVLILVVVEDGLVLVDSVVPFDWSGVLILVVVEDGLVQGSQGYLDCCSKSLNPCCSGRWSRTRTAWNQTRKSLRS